MDKSNATELEENISLSDLEKKQKLILEISYFRTEFEKLLNENSKNYDSKSFKNLLKLSKKIEKDAEEILDIKISSKEKNIYSELKNSNFDSSIIKMSKFI